ncbi:MAG: glutamine synthetase III [Flavobacteriales bacterium]|nr:glutamine synthetase III [Flavobacteriales bacterium]
MTTHRFSALNTVLTRTPNIVPPPSDKVSDYFGTNVFNQVAMRKFLSEEAYESVMGTIEKGATVDRKMADQIASSMKAWALSKGASHYTHWFQPLTGLTAEKHDAFFNPIEGGLAIEKFDGDQLAQAEPDASSFPSGGIRNTFEARGYTAWDTSSPAFVIGRTLCIPTVFVSYTGESLDYKAPLLKAMHVLDRAATDVCQYFDKNVSKVSATLGWEQEYFLIDTALFNARPDLMVADRTVFGHSSPKDQQLDDHYFGSIPERAAAYIRDFETEALKLGIPVTTRHNEVAPNQFECAPMFEEANLAVDHNQLLMDVMDKVARRHNFRVLMHEKPFAGINGSGKHNNWSMSTNTGVNLLQPGKNPKANLQFLTFFINTIKAVSSHADLLRAGIASAGNDFRLGANEAPPAIISVFIGEQLTKVLGEIEAKVKKGKMSADEKTALKLGIGKIPEILLDNTDRNRTSPFAFTGNKFEFRAVGSASNCAAAMIPMNSIVANQLLDFKKEVDALIQKNVKKDEAIFQVLRSYIISSQDILFEGNNYSEEWVVEAEKRGLANVKTTPGALEAFTKKENIALYEKLGVFSAVELEARQAIKMDKYTMKLQIESRIIGELARNQIIPTAIKYQNILIENVRGLKDIGLLSTDTEVAKKELAGAVDGETYRVHPEDIHGNGLPDGSNAFTQKDSIQTISRHISAIQIYTDSMIEQRRRANRIDSERDKAVAYCDRVKPYFDKIRYHVDKLELLVDDELWPLPKYRELLFTK